MSLGGLFSFAVGGSILIFVLYLTIVSGQSPYFNGLFMLFVPLGFIAFLMLGLGLYLIIQSAVSLKK